MVFVYPFALIKKRHTGKLFFFFDRYVIGGAQRIHLDILNSIPDVQKNLYFTRLSNSEALKDSFYNIPGTKAQDIHFWCDNLLLRLFSVHYYAFYLNRHDSAHIFSSNSTFFYDMLPFIKKGIIKTELLHNFTHGKNGMEFFGLANHQSLDHRIVYDQYTLSNIKKQYAEYNVDQGYLNKILYIEPGVYIPPYRQKAMPAPLKILYAGRGGAQKRIYLLNTIAEKCISEDLPVQFHFAGSMMDELSDKVKQHAIIHGEISSPEKMYELYQGCDVILMTSAYEGFPMLIKEAMACACVPIVTALVGNMAHLKHGQNALLMFEPDDEEGVIRQGVDNIQQLLTEQGKYNEMSNRAYMYASAHFDREAFMNAYRKFLL
jgi:glycosyltransferase involved in cell wall biosynthesis